MARRLRGRAGGSGAGGANPRRMWFRRRRRGGTQLDLSALDRLTELVDRIVALLPEQTAPPERTTERTPEPEPPAAPASPEEWGAVLFVATPSGYRLVDSGGPAPARGGLVELPDGRFRVLRVGPSPLPGDRRRCAFLDREEPPVEGRSPDG